MMNDPVYLEAAYALAARMVNEANPSVDERIIHGFRWLLTRPPTSNEVARLRQLQIDAKNKLAGNPEQARRLLDACTANRSEPASLSPDEFASYVVVASVILNLDEAVMRN
jgi:hypothetical protein